MLWPVLVWVWRDARFGLRRVVVEPDFAPVLMSARPRLSHGLAVSSSFKHILRSSPAGAYTKYQIQRAPIGPVVPTGTVA